jgi:hypothetical protein
MTNCPDLSATARSWNSPLRNSSTVAPGVAVPAMTASPVRSMRAMSKAGKDSSVSGARGGTLSAAAAAVASACTAASAAEPLSGAASGTADTDGETSGAAIAALVSTGGSRQTCMIPKASAAPHAATSTSDGTTIRVIDVAVMIRAPWLDRWLVSTPWGDSAPICYGHQVRQTGYPSVSRAASLWHETDVPRREKSENYSGIAKLGGIDPNRSFVASSLLPPAIARRQV